jgi:hypothetical protein
MVWQLLPPDNIAPFGQYGKGNKHFLRCCPPMIPLLLLAIAHRFTPRHNETLNARDLCNPWAGKDHLFFGKRTTERTPPFLCFSRQVPRPGFEDVAVIACHHYGTLRQMRFIE